MKSLAEAKRRIEVGMVLKVENHVYPELSGDRTVVATLGRAFKLTLPESHPRATESDGSWVNWPTSKSFRTSGPDTFTILNDEYGGTGMEVGSPFATFTLKEV